MVTKVSLAQTTCPFQVGSKSPLQGGQSLHGLKGPQFGEEGKVVSSHIPGGDLEIPGEHH